MRFRGDAYLASSLNPSLRAKSLATGISERRDMDDTISAMSLGKTLGSGRYVSKPFVIFPRGRIDRLLSPVGTIVPHVGFQFQASTLVTEQASVSSRGFGNMYESFRAE